MGKFFLAGLFLGAAVTWAAMNFLVGTGLKGEELDDALRTAFNRGKTDGVTETEEEWQKKLDAERAALEKEHSEKISGLKESVQELGKEKKGLEIKVEGALADVAFAKKRKEAAEQKYADLKASMGGQTAASKQLLVKVTRLRDLRLTIYRRFAEACTVVSQALIGWPDVQLAGEAANGLVRSASQYRKLAQDVQVYIDQHSKELNDELGNLAPYRAGVQERDIAAVDVLAAKIESAMKAMKMDSLVVEATKKDWTDSEVFVEPGDVIQVRATGSWRMALTLATSDAGGWDGASQYKLFRNARAGGLVLQIGISERVHQAYLGKPIVADARGRVKLRMNDKDVRDNGGSLRVDIVCSNSKTLEMVVRLWKAFKKL